MARVRRIRILNQLLRVRDEPEPTPTAATALPPFVCVHGAGMSSALFIDTLRRFAPGRRVIAVDLPGHGQSQSVVAPSLDGYRDTLLALCDGLAVPRAIFIGHSLGAAVALAVAAAAPSRACGLVLLNGAAQLALPDDIWTLVQRHNGQPADATDSLPASFVDRTPDEFADLLFSPSTSPDLRQRWQAVLWAAERSTLLADFALCRTLDLRSQLSGLHVPTLCVAGADDLLVPPPSVRATAALLPQATCHVIERSAHLSHLEQPAAVYELLDSFTREKRS